MDDAKELVKLLESENERLKEGLVTIQSHLADSVKYFVTLAKLDHVIWKINTYLSIVQKKPVFKFVDHHNCRLGKWYDSGEGSKNFLM